MTLRAATAGDTAAVAVLERGLFGVDAWSAGTVREELTGPHRCALVAPAEPGVPGEPRVPSAAAVAGYAVTLVAGDVVDLQRIGVHPAYRRRGLARALLTALLGRAAAAGAERMLLEVSEANAGARAFYAAEGFAEIDRRRRYYRDGSDAVVLLRPVRHNGSHG